jgi:hypothetical protein
MAETRVPNHRAEPVAQILRMEEVRGGKGRLISGGHTCSVTVSQRWMDVERRRGGETAAQKENGSGR